MQHHPRGQMSLPFIAPTSSDLRVSFEFFPPKTEEMEKTLWASLDLLAPLAPSFVSVTYGAGGSTRARTHDIVTRIQQKTGLTAAAHLTCVGATRGEIDDIARAYRDAGIRHIVALRGDIPGGGQKYTPHPDGYAYASDLVAGLRQIADFDISVAGYPEMHPEAASADSDLDNLKRKVEAGAKRVISQFFMEPEDFLRYRDRVAAMGITVPVVPGILPITNVDRTLSFAAQCGAKIPAWMPTLFEGLDDQPKTRQLVAATVAAEQCHVLHENGVKDFHFYTLNRAELTLAICHMLGLRAPKSAAIKTATAAAS